MRPAVIRDACMALAIGAALCLAAAPALADDRPWEQERWTNFYAGGDSSDSDPFADRRWMEIWPRNEAQHESEYSRSLSLNLEENFSFNLRSPLAGEWAPGLAFELRF